jgi:SAM-dependent methyltransferase
MEEKYLHFNTKSGVYDEIRPGYPWEIYELISKYKVFDTNSNILEIGAGNGVASQEIYNKWGSKLTLIEPGIDLCRILQNKFKNNFDVKIINTTFEEYQNNNLFDAIFSATAFHWVNDSIKYRKSNELLKNDGFLIIYWNNYIVDKIEMMDKIQNVYGKHGNGVNDNKNIYEKQMEKIENRRKEVEESGY